MIYLFPKCKLYEVFVLHDGDHKGEAVLRDLKLYQDFVSPNGLLIVEDTKLDRLERGRKGPMWASKKFLKSNSGFVVDNQYGYMLYSQHHNGFLRKVGRF